MQQHISMKNLMVALENKFILFSFCALKNLMQLSKVPKRRHLCMNEKSTNEKPYNFQL